MKGQTRAKGNGRMRAFQIVVFLAVLLLASRQYFISLLVPSTDEVEVPVDMQPSLRLNSAAASQSSIRESPENYVERAPGGTLKMAIGMPKISAAVAVSGRRGLNKSKISANQVLGSLKEGDEVEARAAGPEQRFRRMPSVFSTCVPDDAGVTKVERDAVEYWLNLDAVARKKGFSVKEVRTNGKYDGSVLDYIKIPTRLQEENNSDGDGKECLDHYHYMPGGDQDPRVKRFRDYLRKRQRVSCTDPPSTAERETCKLVDFVQVQESHNSPGSRTTVLLGVWASYLHNDTAGLTIAVPAVWKWTNYTYCPQQDHTCYFQPVHGCAKHSAMDTKYVEGNQGQQHQVEWEAFSRLHDNLSPYRLSAELLLFLLQPHARLQRDLEVARARIGWDSMPRPILVLHIRHGKKWQESEWFPTEDYLQVVRAMVDELGFRSLLVMTDDSEALATVKNVTSTWTDKMIKVVASLDEPEFSRTMFDPRKDNALMIYSGEKNACDVAVVSFLNILLAGQADGFVGTYNSNFGRMVVRLQYATHGYMTPTASLDKFYTEAEGGTCYSGIMCTRHRAPSHGRAASGTYPFSTSLTDGQANLTDLLPRLEAAHQRRYPVIVVKADGWRGLIRTPREACNFLQTAPENQTFNEPIGRALTQPTARESDHVGDSDSWWLKGGKRVTLDACCMENYLLAEESKVIHHACPRGFVAPTTTEDWPLCPGLLPAAGDVECVVVSFGVAGEWAFETAMAASQHRCQVHMFDPTTATKERNEQNAPSGVTFHYGGLSGDFATCSTWHKWHQEKTFAALGGPFRFADEWFAELGFFNLPVADRRRQFRILKLSMAGLEWDVFYQLGMQAPHFLDEVDLILLDIHVGFGCCLKDRNDLIKFQTFADHVFVQHKFRIWYTQPLNVDQRTKTALPIGIPETGAYYRIGLVRPDTTREDTEKPR